MTTWARSQTFSQNAQYSGTAAANTAVTLGASVAPGDVIVLATTVGADTTTLSPTLTDQLGNTYNRLSAAQGGQKLDTGSNASLDGWWCIVTVGGTPVITYKPHTTSQPWLGIKGSHFTGSDAVSTRRASNGAAQVNPGTGTDALSSGSVSAQNGDLLWCGGGAPGTGTAGTLSAGTGFTGSTTDTLLDLLDEWKTATGAAAGTMTDSGGGAATELMIAIAISPATATSSGSGPIIGRSMGPGHRPGRAAEFKVETPQAFEPGPPIIPSFALYGRSFNPGNHVGRFAMVARRTVLGISNPTGQIFVYTGSGGLQSGGAAPVLFIAVPRPTGGLQSGGTAPRLFIAIPKPSGGLQSGGSAPRAFIAVPRVSGGLQSGGVAPMSFTAVPRPTGGLHSGGSAPMSAQLSHRPSGGLTAGGTAPRLFILSVRPSGGLTMGGAASVVFVPGGQPQQTRSTTLWIGMGIRV